VVLAARGRIARVGSTWIAVVATGRRAGADAVDAQVAGRTDVSVVTSGLDVRCNAHARFRAAYVIGARIPVVADNFDAGAFSRLAGIFQSTRIAVVTRCSIADRFLKTVPRGLVTVHRKASPGSTALVIRRAALFRRLDTGIVPHIGMLCQVDL